jgi:hypothetical protein
VYGAGSEDMDTLTFNAPVLLRHLTFSEARKAPILEVHLPAVLEGLEMDLPQVLYHNSMQKKVYDLSYSSLSSVFSSVAITSSLSKE